MLRETVLDAVFLSAAPNTMDSRLLQLLRTDFYDRYFAIDALNTFLPVLRVDDNGIFLTAVGLYILNVDLTDTLTPRLFSRN